MSEIVIKAKTADRLDWHELLDFQGNLKMRTPQQVDRLCNAIKTEGFLFPFFVWREGTKNWTLDGHGRLAALKRLEGEGYSIAPVPVVYVEAAGKREAKKALLLLNSRYGTITQAGYDEFVVDCDFTTQDTDDFVIPEVNFIVQETKKNENKEFQVDNDKIEYNRLIIVYSSEQKEDLEDRLGIQIDKSIYNAEELLNAV